MARDLGDAAGQTYPRIEWSVSGPPVRPIGAFRVGMADPGRFGLVPRSSKSGLPAPNSAVLWSEMADFGRFPGSRISAAPPTYSPVLMYLGIQVLVGCLELEIATFANTLRCFETSGNPGFVWFPGARNRDFREEVPPF